MSIASITPFDTSSVLPLDVPSISVQCVNNLCSYVLRPGVCEKLSDAEWQSLTPRVIEVFKNYLAGNEFIDETMPLIDDDRPPRQCDAVTKRLFAKVATDFRDVVESMGGNPNQISVKNTFFRGGNVKNAFISPPYDLSISPALVYALYGWEESPRARQMALGILAHESAHRILKHSERGIARVIKASGISVSKEESKNISLMIQKVANILGTFKSQDDQARFLSRFRELVKNAVLNSNDEKEADLLTMRNPFYARGLRDSIFKELNDCRQIEKRLETLYGSGLSLACDVGVAPHPARSSRIKYLTDALCDEYPKENRDICRDSAVRNWNNGTCAVFDV